MLDDLRALIFLESTGTISEAATRLRLTQSAVTKRIQALEANLGYKLVEADGRRLKLTAKGLVLISRARPLLLEIEGLKDLGGEEDVERSMAIGIADSIASSWGPKLIKRSLKIVPNLYLEMHVHRSTLVLEQIRSGRYELGLVAGAQSRDLIWNYLADEPMVLVGLTQSAKRSGNILSIEPNSATWREIGKSALQHEKLQGKKMVFLESFSAAVQMAKEGFGQALVPLGLAKTLGVKNEDFTFLSPRIQRRVYFVTRKTVAEISCVRDLFKAMQDKISF